MSELYTDKKRDLIKLNSKSRTFFLAEKCIALLSPNAMDETIQIALFKGYTTSRKWRRYICSNTK